MHFLVLLLLLLFCISAALADPDPQRNYKAYQEILKREAAFNADDPDMAYRLFRTMHPATVKKEEEKKVSLMTAVNHHPLARRFREKLYLREDIIAASTVEAERLVKEAIGDLKPKPRMAVERLPYRAIEEKEPVSTTSPVTLPYDVSIIIHQSALHTHIAEQLGFRHDTPLAYLARAAALRGRHGFIDYLVWLGLDPNEQDEKGYPLLLHAVQSGSLGTVDRLIFYGADRFWKHPDGCPLLYHAAYHLDLPMAQKIINPGDATWSGSSRPPMGAQAMDQNDVALFAFLVQHGAEMNWRDVNGASALYFAVRRDSYDVVKFLLESGENASQEQWPGDSLLTAACIDRNKDMVALLLQHGANLVDSRDRHILYLQQSESLPKCILKMLVDAVVRVDHRDISVFISLALGREELAPLALKLLDQGADPNARIDGAPLLYYALMQSNLDAANVLYWHGAKVDQHYRAVLLIDRPEIKRNARAYQWLLDHGA